MQKMFFAAALGAAFVLGACSPASKGDDANTDKDTVVVMNNESQTLRDVQGFWKFSSVAPATRSDLPVAYAMEVTADGTLIIHQYDLRSKTSFGSKIGKLNVVGEGYGELAIDEAGYTAFAAPMLRYQCGNATECIQDFQFKLSEQLRYETPTWTVSSSSLSFDGMLSGFSGRKASIETTGKVLALVRKNSEPIIALAQRSIQLGPIPSLPLKKITVQVNGTTVDHPVGSDQTYTCANGKPSVVPAFINSITLGKDMTVNLNGERTELLAFTGSGSDVFNGFTFWNPYRCSAKACSAVSLKIRDEQRVSLTESVDDCMTVEYTYGPVL